MLIHDAARPYVSQRLINDSLYHLEKYDASIPIINCDDSLINVSTHNQQIKYLDRNPADQLWDNQPKRPYSKVFQHALKYSGRSVEKKISLIQSILKSNQCDYYILSSLDSIAWLLNIRGNDILYTPLNLAYAIITQDKKIEKLEGLVEKLINELEEK